MSGIDFINLGNTLGALLVGFLFALMLYGCSVAQVLYYVWKYPEDRWMLKLLVAMLWLEQLLTARKIVWHYLVAGHEGSLELAKLYSTAVVTTQAEYALALLYLHHLETLVRGVQGYIYDSDHRVSSALTFAGPDSRHVLLLINSECALPAVIRLHGDAHWPVTVTGFVNVNEALHNFSFPNIFSAAKSTATLQVSSASLTDICITIASTHALSRHNTGFMGTRDLIHNLQVLVINRGVLTTLIQTIQMIIYISLPKNVLYWVLLQLPGSKIYVNSLLAVLNARHHLRRNGVTYISNAFKDSAVEIDRIELQAIPVVRPRSFE
ncbi:uncharacterized protein LAESUDRAFT_752728 [Laetiporus sulphureus 93-53]|uniref:DUF6534 domain-containing protein n=1 Tax=Laetiporus sulphureus 93-53 TaxID=1314785 RepID=A0A165BN98_9APHY|nr:uncharacterized protein LAESUDRAFT_752728 [Laetiporus sulphureus 93-53]KZT01351.1 hypothetical protein LAESUDRAFT_752728 [Laetiporus sulphureus 93-53]